MSVRLSPGVLAVAAAAVALASGGVGYGLAHLHLSAGAPQGPAASGRKVLYWYDPMVPAQHFDKPGKSPFMDMQLVPRYAGEPAAAPGVQIDPAAVQSLGVRLATVERGPFGQSVDAAGVLDFNQRQVAVVQARAAGFVQRVYGRAPADVVPAGAPLADLLVPSWAGSQAEYLAVRKLGDPGLEAAARQRLRLLGMPDPLIDAVARDGRSRTTITITTPVGGAIQTLDVRQGMTVSAGQTLAQVSSLSPIWLTAAVPEAQAAQVRVGADVTAALAAFPGETFKGRISDILPAAQADSRTLQVRVELPNPKGRLRPGMFATAHLNGPASDALFVPAEAVIRTGKRALVMVAGDGGRYQPVEVQIGHQDGDRLEVLAGLSEGQKVVASGQFLIDSEASLAGIQAKPLASAASARKAALYETRGRVEALTGDHITFSHEPVPAIGWPAMTMTFKLAEPGLAKGLKVGDRAAFGFEQTPSEPVVRAIKPEAGR
jgi:Cu(I)/Ag(I) efflux system membrane fusion protein